MWWLPTSRGDFMASGSLGQYIYVNPLKNLIVVRLGKNTGHIDWVNLFERVNRVSNPRISNPGQNVVCGMLYFVFCNFKYLKKHFTP
jgi:hypothetical protein